MNRKLAMGLRAIGVLLLVVLAWTGVSGSIEQYAEMHTTAQQLQTAAQLAFGITSILALIVTFRAARWGRAAYIAFVASVTLAGGLAPYAWGGQAIGPSVAAGVASLVVAWLIVWLVRA